MKVVGNGISEPSTVSSKVSSQTFGTFFSKAPSKVSRTATSKVGSCSGWHRAQEGISIDGNDLVQKKRLCIYIYYIFSYLFM